MASLKFHGNLHTSQFEDCEYKYEMIKGLLNLNLALREKCPNTELFLVRIFLYSVWIQKNTDQK